MWKLLLLMSHTHKMPFILRWCGNCLYLSSVFDLSYQYLHNQRHIHVCTCQRIRYTYQVTSKSSSSNYALKISWKIMSRNDLNEINFLIHLSATSLPCSYKLNVRKYLWINCNYLFCHCQCLLSPVNYVSMQLLYQYCTWRQLNWYSGINPCAWLLKFSI